MARVTLTVEDGDDAQPVELTLLLLSDPKDKPEPPSRRPRPAGTVITPGQTADPGCVLQLDRTVVRMRLETMMKGVETPAPTP